MNILRVVSVGSARGLYGGPFDTASRQVDLLRSIGASVELLFGSFRHDAPETQVPPTLRIWRPSRVRSFALAIPVAGLIRTVGRVRAAAIVHISFAREPIPTFALLTAVILRKKVVLQPHGMLTSRTSRLHKVVDIGLRALAGRASCFIALTETEKSEIQAWLRAELPVVVIPNPLPPELNGLQVRPARTGPSPRISFIGRLHPRKRVLDFARAAKMTPPHVGTFVVVGPDGGDLSTLLTEVSATPNLQYLGSVSPGLIPEILRETDIFVLPSHNEPWGNVLVSALALGIPAVVTESAALSATIRELGAGIVVRDSSPTSIASAVVRLLSDRDLYAEASKAAIRLAGELSDGKRIAVLLMEAYKKE